MYNLGDQFRVDQSKAIANPKNIIQGKRYRFTILSDRLIRMEYNPKGIFLDNPTELVWFRNFPFNEFTSREDSTFIEIATKSFRLTYVKNKPFKGSRFNPMGNMRVELLNSEKIWYYGHPEVRNIKAPGMSLDADKKLKYQKSLFSFDGFSSIDDSNSQIMDEMGNLNDNPDNHIDMYLFAYLNDFEGCLKDYYALTGSPAMVPRYALGNWWYQNKEYNDESLAELIEDFHYQEIPLSVLMLNSNWHLNKYENKDKIKSGFTWNKDKIKAPFETINALHARGLNIGLSVDPTSGIYPYEEYYEKAKQYLKHEGDGIIPFNALNTRIIDVYLKLLIHPIDALGADFYFIDVDDPKKIKELFNLNHYQFYDMYRNYRKRPMILSRSAMVAPHRYPISYSGKTIVSWDTLKMLPFYTSSAANLGVSWWSHDIGGYHKGIEDDELYTRYVQFGTFCPILRFSADSGKYYKREPWLWNIKTYKIAQTYLKMRHQLIPYLYTEAYNYYKNGKPLIEPVYHKYPKIFDDLNFRNEYYLGSQLFVSPIVSKKELIMNRVIHKFFIPEGTWYDFASGKKFPGNQNYVAFYKDQEYPVFAKSGSILVMGENAELNNINPPKDLEIHIFPGESNTYKLYEDDGISDLYRKGYYISTAIDYNYLPSNYTVIIRALEGKTGIIPEVRNYRIRFRNTKKADEVIAHFNNGPIESHSYVDGADFVVEVKDIKTIGQLTINCKGQDIEIDAMRLINEDIETIISDLQIQTELKEKIDHVLFGDLPINKKRIEIRKLSRFGLERKFIKLFLKLLEYIKKV
jgi:alpha-glucosidase (family GH31 glycosyl hydrolase)